MYLRKDWASNLIDYMTHSWQYNFNTVHKSASASTKFESEYALSRVSLQDVEPNIEQESPIFAVNTLTNFQKG